MAERPVVRILRRAVVESLNRRLMEQPYEDEIRSVEGPVAGLPSTDTLASERVVDHQ